MYHDLLLSLLAAVVQWLLQTHLVMNVQLIGSLHCLDTESAVLTFHDYCRRSDLYSSSNCNFLPSSKTPVISVPLAFRSCISLSPQNIFTYRQIIFFAVGVTQFHLKIALNIF